MDTYPHGHAESVLASHRWRTAENSARYLLPSLGPGIDVLDVGCGPGPITVDLARRVAPGRVVGLDVSAAPLEEARSLASREGVPVTFVVGDGYALEASDALGRPAQRCRTRRRAAAAVLGARGGAA